MPEFWTERASQTGQPGRTVSVSGRSFRSWCLDFALAYVGGLLIGAPAGLAAVWLTRRDLALTLLILLSMAGVLSALRLRRRCG